MHLWLIGMMGSGKSTVGELVAQTLKMPFVDLDREIEGRAGTPVTEIFAKHGEAAFRREESRVLRATAKARDSVIATGGGAVLRSANVDCMRSSGRVMWLDVHASVLKLRLETSHASRPLIAGSLDRLDEISETRRQIYSHAADARVDAASEPAKVAEQVVEEWRSNGSPIVARGERGEYAIHVGRGILSSLGGRTVEALPSLRRAIVITDAKVATHARTAISSLRAAGLHVDAISIPGGEKSKTLATVTRLWDRMLTLGVDRSTAVVAIGGGVIGDLAGFVAATTLRGLPLVHVPTTLVAQVDSAIGSKCGFDTRHGKNLVGAFHEPALVVADVETLTSLPAREVSAGLAEVVKYGAIADESLFARVERRRRDRFLADLREVESIVRACVEIKAGIVASDPRERGGRALLNFGHTVGHALEVAASFRGILHGEAVAAGMVAEAELASDLGMCAATDVERLAGLLHDLELPVGLSASRAARFIRMDKKRRGSDLSFPMLRSIGHATVESIPVSALVSLLSRSNRSPEER